MVVLPSSVMVVAVLESDPIDIAEGSDEVDEVDEDWPGGGLGDGGEVG